MKYGFDMVFASLATVCTYLFGGWDAALIVLVAFMAIDYLSGVLIAILNGKLSSQVGFRGLAKKLLIVLMLAAGVLLDRLLGGGQWMFRSLVAYFYIANEGISILENAAALGLPVPAALRRALEQLSKEQEK